MPDAQETAGVTDDRPTSSDADDAAQRDHGEQPAQEPEHEQEYNDRDSLDFDPDDGLYTGTAVDGGTKIPGPHEQVDDIEPGDEDDETIADE